MTTSEPMTQTVRCRELQRMCASDAPPQLVDVRTPGEFGTAHIPGSSNVPLDSLRRNRDAVAARLRGPADVVLICRSGQRARQAEQLLRRAGLSNVCVLDGGILAWQAHGFEVNEGRRRWDLERQVRLVVGVVVLAAVLGSVAVPWLKWIAAAMGAGLTFAALTNTCALGMLLARLPYNRGASCDTAGSAKVG
ncbi:rhodanese-like domain protein [Mycolicibacterium hassiacum DSM 44199]|uniref:Rhodanese-like domain protein n=1 Tax=Mycolicibacterium hassiacum (strain DSM 44199 / CIP 105218 / JCM 12690 / 3849) TaxID=1122247 RepID=K5BEP4_MYCHD|nr:rhodanese-like domain-containing protein [Mycolicibacterium hassiacum]EKF23177.1 rhodanese-like domain protein [Mycolicibacterium hassiacum DSM 44199]VCT89646.1 Inner membrane protein YgaP [Mycolicibacterium hassiacum DSM 44199]